MKNTKLIMKNIVPVR